MQDGDLGNKNHVLTSWKEIASYLGKGVRTVQRWEKDFGLPIRRPIGSDKSAIIARTSDLDAWVAMRCATRNLPDGAAVRSRNLLAVRSSLAAGLATAQMLHELHSTLLAEVRTALEGLQSEILQMRSGVRRPPGPRSALPAPAVLLSADGSQGIDAA
ncbi:MAG: hypothetical protein WBW84_05290 [Acidobacteriaceae bacterium]